MEAQCVTINPGVGETTMLLLTPLLWWIMNFSNNKPSTDMLYSQISILQYWRICNSRISLQNQSLYLYLYPQRKSVRAVEMKTFAEQEQVHPLILSPSICLNSSVPRGRGCARGWACVRPCVRAVYLFSTACRSGSPLPLNRWGSVLWALNSQHSGQMVRLSATLCVWVCECVCSIRQKARSKYLSKAKRQVVVWGTLE